MTHRDVISTFGRRVARLLRSEVEQLQAARVCAAGVSALLPPLTFSYLRTCVWRAAGLRLGQRSRIMGPLYVTGPGDHRQLVTLGDDTLVTGPLRIDLAAPVTIGSRVRIGHDVLLLTIDHEIGPAESRCADNLACPIQIGDGAWLSSRCVLLPGVSVGAGAVVAAGAVVTHDVPPNTLVAGVPARVIRSLDEAEPRSDRLLRSDRLAAARGDSRERVYRYG